MKISIIKKRDIKLLFIISLLSFTSIHNFAFSQWIQKGQDIDGEVANDRSGSKISMSSDGLTVAVGASSNSGNGVFSGHVRVYKFNGMNWIQQGSDIDGEAAGDRFGSSVSVNSDGLIVAIGAILNSENDVFSGHVRVYKFNGTNWIQQGSDIDGEAVGDQSGSSVSISSDGLIVAIGASFNDENGIDAGHVRIYKFNGTNWIQQGSDIDGEVAGDESGTSVSMSADGLIVAIGAILNNGNGFDAGHVRVYKFNGMNWIQQGSDIDGEANNRYGTSINLSADGLTLAIGVLYNNFTRVYKFNGTNWIQQGSDIDGEATIDQSGSSVSLSSNGLTIAIGARGNDGTGIDAGHVRIYKFNGTNWTQQGSDIDGEAAGDRSGSAVSISSDGLTLAIGAPFNGGNGMDAGHVRVYSFSTASIVNEQNTLSNNISIFPNPTQGIVNINFGELKKVSIKVFSISGQLIYQKNNITNVNHKFELKEAPNVYFIELNTQDDKQLYKLIKN